MSTPRVHHQPNEETIAGSQLTAFAASCAERAGPEVAESYAALHAWSLAEPQAFWASFLAWSKLPRGGSDDPPIAGADHPETATFFPEVTLNYAEALLEGDDDAPAVTARSEDGSRVRVTRGELRADVYSAAADLRSLGVEAGDRVVAVVRNQIEAIVCGLAAASLGASWSSVAPDLAAAAALSRFQPLEPTVLIAHTSYPYQGVRRDLGDKLREIVGGLPSLRAVLTVDTQAELGDLGVREVLASFVMGAAVEPAAPVRVPFDHPLFILFSSGTTGAPKCIVHGHGGTLVEHTKELRLHCDIGPGSKLYYHTSCAWMMWNWQLSALACGAEIVVYDGSVSYPDRDALLKMVAEEGITHFGTSPAYLQFLRDARIEPPPMPGLRAIMSTGSILYDNQYDWVAEHIGDIPVQSISGGTDIVGCFVLGNANLPVWRGESQCVSLGLDVRAMTAEGPLRSGRGELVCLNAFPSRPVGLYDDPDGRAFHRAYFADHEGMWTHGDFLELTERGTARILGRSDGVMNIQGIRIGPAEIYRVLQQVPEIVTALATDQEAAREIGGRRLVLLVVLQEGITLDRPLTLRIKKRLKENASMAHVPRVIVQLEGLPTTHSGKVSERAASDALNGRVVRNRSALRNPEIIDQLLEHPQLKT